MIMPVLENLKHELFAQAIAEGSSATAAYRSHVAEPNTRIEHCMSGASRLMADAKVESRVAELRREFAYVLENRFGVRRETLARFLVGVMVTPIGEVDENHPLCQEYMTAPNQHGISSRYKMPSNLDAVEKLIKLTGWYAPEKIEHSGGLDGLIAELTGARSRKSCPVTCTPARVLSQQGGGVHPSGALRSP